MDPNQLTAISEAIRRRAGMMPSGAGVAGGMPVTNAQTPINPIANAGVATPPPPNPMTQGMGVPAGSSPSDGAVSAMNNAQPGEAQMIVKALISRMNKLTPQPQ